MMEYEKSTKTKILSNQQKLRVPDLEREHQILDHVISWFCERLAFVHYACFYTQVWSSRGGVYTSLRPS